MALVRLEQLVDLRAHVARLRAAGRPVVLVPTMGDLHDGHLSLARIGAQLGQVVVSVFVNPTQFAPHEDFASYPRDLDRDLQLLGQLQVSAVFAPAVTTMYPPGDGTTVEVRGVSEPLCGQHRPGHFRGVATVVTKLLCMVQPDIAVFGSKDAQQCLVLRRMVQDLALPVRLVFGPTVRDTDGLALSSRNRYLSPADRQQALRLSRALWAARTLAEQGERQVAALEAAMLAELSPLRVDYAQARSVPDLQSLSVAQGRVLLAVAAHVGRARLIDNLCLEFLADGVREAPLDDAALPPWPAQAQIVTDQTARRRG